MFNIDDIRMMFKTKLSRQEFRGNTVELAPASFICSKDRIFGEPNQDYIKAEIEWYESQDRNVNKLFDIYGQEVKIWKDVADDFGYINSNYGWCIYSDANGNQFDRCVAALQKDPLTRHAQMYYTNPFMHTRQSIAGRRDHMCTYAVSYHMNEGGIDAHVYMRSNDAVFGYNNDYAWQRHVLRKLCDTLGNQMGNIFWNASSLHVYERHWDLIK